jgi:hypothetical protein
MGGMRMLLRVIAVLMTVSSMGAAASPGQSVDWPERWDAVLKESQGRLEAGESKAARHMLSRLLSDVLETSPPSDRTDRLLADVLTQLALAEAGDGANDDAVWHWAIAQNIVRDVALADLAPFGRPADLLTSNVCPRPQNSVHNRRVVHPLRRSRSDKSRNILEQQ